MKTSPAERRKIVDKAHLKVSVTRQCELLAIHRSGYYYNLQEKKEDAFNLELMKLIDSQNINPLNTIQFRIILSVSDI
ncbi:MAG: hypothetical protein AB2L20_21655 [Mangrovibacterium sp.]